MGGASRFSLKTGRRLHTPRGYPPPCDIGDRRAPMWQNLWWPVEYDLIDGPLEAPIFDLVGFATGGRAHGSQQPFEQIINSSSPHCKASSVTVWQTKRVDLGVAPSAVRTVSRCADAVTDQPQQRNSSSSTPARCLDRRRVQPHRLGLTKLACQAGFVISFPHSWRSGLSRRSVLHADRPIARRQQPSMTVVSIRLP